MKPLGCFSAIFVQYSDVFEKSVLRFIDNVFCLARRKAELLGKLLEAYAVEKSALEHCAVTFTEDPFVNEAAPFAARVVKAVEVYSASPPSSTNFACLLRRGFLLAYSYPQSLPHCLPRFRRRQYLCLRRPAYNRS